MRVALILVMLSMCMGCAAAPPTVARVDLARYAGRWYEIARLPQGFEAGCAGVTATYTVLADGRVGVENVCHEGGLAGKLRTINGTARVVDPPANAKLKVTFFWPFEGDYWVFWLNDDYTTAAVGSPDRQSLWILHRTPRMADGAWAEVTDWLKGQGFDVDRLEKTPQYEALKKESAGRDEG